MENNPRRRPIISILRPHNKAGAFLVGGVWCAFLIGSNGSAEPRVLSCALPLESLFQMSYDARPFVRAMKAQGNDDGEITWQVSYVLIALAEMGGSTRSRWYESQGRDLAR